MKVIPIYILALVSIFSQCKISKNTTSKNSIKHQQLAEIVITDSKKIAPQYAYQESNKRTIDLLHTTLWLNFDYEKQHVLGKANLTFKPYFSPQNTVTLDAKKFILHTIAIIDIDTVLLHYTYTENSIVIDLDKTYTARDTFTLYIDYTARPNEITEEGSAAISDAKGLYFINPTLSIKNKPRQIWSQGETQSNSGWFPTIDVPNEKMTQEIYLTVDSTDITLSNGELIYSKNNNNGKRTDYWSQRLPHAPYLAMIAIGEFIETKDKWRDTVEVNSYLEKNYAPYAKMIFGTTPEMMECFSKKLGVDYPWEKFSQIVVRDFVSGAMENTSAVIHFEPVQHNAREHLDNKWEDIIAHELFHHWFGDLVTCESWSNISLNESFATYGEYIWNEYKYGKMHADLEFDNNLQAYLRQKNAHQKNLIRYHYKSREDVFDVVSYQKGSRVIHMLRNYVGDEAFFASLKFYLTKHQFKTVEIHNLRMAFEEITGQDLNWFFNQWYLNSGHPILEISYTYNESKTSVNININQSQDTSKIGVFKLPIAIDVYSNGKVKRTNVMVDKANWNVTLTSQYKINLTNVDGDKILLAKITDNKTLDEYYYQYKNAPNYIAKLEATNAIVEAKIDTVNAALFDMVNTSLKDTFYGIKELGMQLIEAIPDENKLAFKEPITLLAKYDTKASIRADAIRMLSEIDTENSMAIFMAGLKDSAYSVVGASLYAIASIDGEKALEEAIPFLKEKNLRLQFTISNIIAQYAITDYIAYFEELIPQSGYYNSLIFNNYTQYLTKQDSTILQKSFPQLRSWFLEKEGDYKAQVIKCIESLQKSNIVKYDDASAELKHKNISKDKILLNTKKQLSAKSMYDQLGLVIAE